MNIKILAVIALMALGIDTQTVNMCSYFPSPAPNEQIVSQGYVGSAPLVAKRYKSTAEGFTLDEYTSSGWVDSWKYKCSNGQLIEFADAFPGGVLAVMSPNYPIKWGGVQSVGDVVRGSAYIDPALSKGIAPSPNNWGYQYVRFDAFHEIFVNDQGIEFSDVVEIYVSQSWCKTSLCDWPNGQTIHVMRYWLAPGLGFIQIDYGDDGQNLEAVRFAEKMWVTP